MKKGLLLFLFALIAFRLSAQEDAANMLDIIHLKDGGVVRGVITERVEGDFVRILIDRKKKMVVKFSEIEKIEQEEMNEHGVMFTPSDFQKTGYAIQADMGFQRDAKDKNLDRIQMDIVNGFRVNPYLSFGIGTALRFYTGARDLLIPLYGNVRLKLLHRKLSPFFSASYGYSFDSSNDEEGLRFKGLGAFFKPSIGLSVQTFRKSFFCAGIQWEQQQFLKAAASQSYFYSPAGLNGNFTSRSFGFFAGYGF